MTNRILKSTIAASLAFTLAACGDDNGLGPAIELTETETQEMMEVLGTLALGGIDIVPQGGAAAIVGSPTIAFATFNVSETLPCPVSGSRHTTGNVTTEGPDEAPTGFTASFTQTYTNCAAPAETGTVWTFNTAPSLTLSLNATGNPETETFSANMNFNGGFQVSSDDGRSGSCMITLTWTLNATAEESLSASVTGTVCGRQVSQSIDFSA